MRQPARLACFALPAACALLAFLGAFRPAPAALPATPPSATPSSALPPAAALAVPAALRGAPALPAILALATSTVLPLSAAQPTASPTPPSAAADDLQRLASDFWAWRAVGQPISGDDIPRILRPHGWAPDWSAAAVAARRRDLERFTARWRALGDLQHGAHPSHASAVARQTPPGAASPGAHPAHPTVAEQVDYRLLGSALARVRWELDGVRLWRRDPGFYLAQTLGALLDALLPPPPFTPERGRDVVARLASFPRTLADARANLDQAVQPFARLALADLEDAGGRLRQAMAALRPLLAAASRQRLDAEVPRAAAALDAYRDWLRSRVAGMPAAVAVGREPYVAFLRQVALLPFTPEQILAMGRQEWARSVAAEALESRRDRGLPELPLLPSQAAQIARARRDELAIRRFLAARGILTVPPWLPHYVYRPLPAYVAPLADFGEGTDFPLAPLADPTSTRYVPPPSPALGYFALSMARDPRADMVHEGIPGHGCQLALARRHPDAIRRHWYDSSANEGIGFYAEEMMLQMGLFDDSPRTREMIWNYARLRALRVEVDVRLALGSFSIDQAADYLRTAVPMDAPTARAEAASFAAAPGFAIGYQIGKLQIVNLLAETRRRQGQDFDLRNFHDFVWRNGNVPLALQRWELLGLDDEIRVLDGQPPRQ
ncbi:MAG TPA: DUF885 family protein [Thermoanaerobaculia bacterium]|nr:DUF885 family protein [Thermoanaerobaculia bacterium]